jgi:hypothetical protein
MGDDIKLLSDWKWAELIEVIETQLFHRHPDFYFTSIIFMKFRLKKPSCLCALSSWNVYIGLHGTLYELEII